MRSVLVSYDNDAGATYVTVTNENVARTASVSDLVMVDLDATGKPVGVEFLVPPREITTDLLAPMIDRFPSLNKLTNLHDWLLTAA